MKELLQLAWDVVLFRHAAYAQHATRADALKRGLLLLVLVTLLAGVVPLVINVVNGLRPLDLEAQRREAEQGFREFFQIMGPYLNLPSGLGARQSGRVLSV